MDTAHSHQGERTYSPLKLGGKLLLLSAMATVVMVAARVAVDAD